MNQGSYTVFTSTSPIGKRFELSEGTLKKTVLGQLYAGNYERKSFNSADEFIEQLSNVSTSQAISASVPADDSLSGELTVKGKPREGALARTKENFAFPSTAGVMTLDYDPTSVIFSRDELVNLVRTVGDIPEDVALIWWCSGSSHVFNGDTELQGLKGQRLYLLVENARDIPRAGAALANRCWLMGYGRIEVSKAGAKLERSIFDSAMFEPARLDFIGGAVCEPPVEQRRGSPINLGGTKLLNSVTAFRDLSGEEEATLTGIKKEAKDKAEPECDRRREESMAEKCQHCRNNWKTKVCQLQTRKIGRGVFCAQHTKANPLQVITGLSWKTAKQSQLRNSWTTGSSTTRSRLKILSTQTTVEESIVDFVLRPSDTSTAQLCTWSCHLQIDTPNSRRRVESR